MKRQEAIECAVLAVGDVYDNLVDRLDELRPRGVNEAAWTALTLGALSGVVEGILSRFPEKSEVIAEACAAGRRDIARMDAVIARQEERK